MSFKEVINQTALKNHLVEMVQQNRLGHALLFLGKEGSGALPAAIAFAQYLVCEKRNGQSIQATNNLFGSSQANQANIENDTTQPDACGTCSACIKASRLAHPDIHYSYPVVPKKSGDKPVSTDYINEWRSFVSQYPYGNVFDWLQFIGAENKQGNITAQECNDIIRKLSLKSFESEYKVLILWMPEYLGNEGNKLLKLIEEPPAKTLFILVTENESLILPTILSRTLLIKVPSLDIKEVADALVEKNNVPADQARYAAAISEGNYREALRFLQHTGQDWGSLLRDWLNAIVKNGPVAQVKWIDEISKIGREKQKQFLRYFNHLLEQAIRLQIIGAGQLSLPEDEQDFALRLNKIADLSQQQAIIEELDKAIYFIERNAHAKMLFHALTIKLYHIIADKSLILID